MYRLERRRESSGEMEVKWIVVISVGLVLYVGLSECGVSVIVFTFTYNNQLNVLFVDDPQTIGEYFGHVSILVRPEIS